MLLLWDGARRVLHRLRSPGFSRASLASELFGCLLRCLAVASPFLLLQLWAWFRFCVEGPTRPWCAALPPFVYSFVQKEYWGLGLLTFYTRQQAPNILLGAPVLLLTACGGIAAVRGARRREREERESVEQNRPVELGEVERKARPGFLCGLRLTRDAQAPGLAEQQRRRCDAAMSLQRVQF